MQQRGKNRLRTVRDAIYGLISLSDLATSIIDTPFFQRLRFLRQLGVCHYVYPSANHTRFEHSLGVYHLAGVYISHLLRTLPEAKRVSPRTVELIQIAGLVHDIGHTILSHLFDTHLAEELGVPHHEERGTRLFEHLVRSFHIDMQDSEIAFVQSLIRGKKEDGFSQGWMYEIVANGRCGLDVDKLDYLVRDSNSLGLPASQIQVARIFSMATILDDEMHIAFHEKIYLQISDVFQTRYRLHRDVYHHRAVVAVEMMLVQVLRRAAVVYDWKTKFQCFEWTSLTDSFLDGVLCTSEDREIHDGMQMLHTRKLWKPVSSNEEGSVEVKSVLGFSSHANDNPLARVLFFNDENPKDVFTLRAPDVSALLSANSHEIQHIYFAKRTTLGKEVSSTVAL